MGCRSAACRQGPHGSRVLLRVRECVWMVVFCHRVATRITQALWDERSNLEPGHAVVWFDWMQYVTIPLASVSAGDMYYGTARMEISVFGVVLLLNRGSGIETINVILVSEILDHTTLFSTIMLDRIVTMLTGMGAWQHVALWCDCGPHFRSFEMLAYLEETWFGKLGCPVSLNLFAEKHGKGLVDALFGQLRGWIRQYLMGGDKIIKTMAELVKVLTDGATQDEALDPPPHGPCYHVEIIDSPEKPTEVLQWRGEVAIQSTYCLEVRPRSVHFPNRASWVNHILRDTPMHKVIHISQQEYRVS